MSTITLPNLIIGGVVKGGTTSLYTYLSMHPDVCASYKKETDYFMPIIHGQKLAIIDEYSKYFSNFKGEKYILDASPRYMHGGENIANSIHAHLGPVKIIFILRDPIERLNSFYRHLKRGIKIPKEWTFETYINHSLELFNKSDDVNQEMYKNIYILAMVEGLYFHFLSQWYSVFEDSIKIIFFDELKNNSHLFMNEVCRWLKLNSEVYQTSDLNVENRSYIYKYRYFQNIALSLNARFETLLRKNHRLKNNLRRIYYAINEDTSHKETMTDETRDRLKSFYYEDSCRLSKMLTLKGYSNLPNWLQV